MLYLLLAASAFVLFWFARSWILNERHPTPGTVRICEPVS